MDNQDNKANKDVIQTPVRLEEFYSGDILCHSLMDADDNVLTPTPRSSAHPGRSVTNRPKANT